MMQKNVRYACMALIVALSAFPAAAPGVSQTRQLHIPVDAACQAAAALPQHVAALPQFGQALLRRKNVRILAIGSSSTEGVGATSRAANYPSQLQSLLQAALPDEQIEVINLGIGGEVAQKTAERIEKETIRLSPDLVLWQVGTNDALTNTPIADYEATVQGALRFLKGRNFDLLLVGMQWTRKLAANPAYAAVRDATARLAEAENVTLVSRYDSMRKLAEASGREDMIGPDHLHMNDLGYRCLAQQVAIGLSRAVSGEASAKQL